MHDNTRPWDDPEALAHGNPPLDVYLTLTRLEDTVQRLPPPGTTDDVALLQQVLQVTTDLVALTQRLLRGWQAQQAEVQTCLLTWRQQSQTLETTEMLIQVQAATLREQTAQLRRAPWWAFLAGAGLMGLVVLVVLGMGRTTSLPPMSPTWQVIPSLPMEPEWERPTEELPSTAPDATPAPETDGTPAGEEP